MALPRFHVCFALATGFGALAVSPPVHAEGVRTWLEIRRDRGSSLCPSEQSVFGAIARLFPTAPILRSMDESQASASAVVSVRRTTQGGHEALIRVTRPRDGERIIVDQDPGCEGLADALAVALVMLIEPERAAAPPIVAAGDPPRNVTPPNTAPSTTAPPNAAPSPLNATSAPTSTNAPGGATSTIAPPNVASPHREVAAPQQTSKETAQSTPLGSVTLDPSIERGRAQVTSANARTPFLRTSAGAFALGGLGLVSEPSAGAGVSLATAWSSGLGLVLEGTRLWALPAERAPGRIVMDLYAVLFSGCYRSTLSSRATLGSCLTFGGGAQHAAAQGFASNGSRTRPWLVLGPRLELGWRWNDWLEGVTSLSAIGHLRRYSFSIQQLEVVADAPWVGLMLDLGIRAELPFFATRS